MDALNLLLSCYLSYGDNENKSQTSDDFSSPYFLIKPHTATIFDKPAWAYSSHKPSFRHFCQLIPENFLRHSDEQESLAATEGAITLVLAFLRPCVVREHDCM